MGKGLSLSGKIAAGAFAVHTLAGCVTSSMAEYGRTWKYLGDGIYAESQHAVDNIKLIVGIKLGKIKVEQVNGVYVLNGSYIDFLVPKRVYDQIYQEIADSNGGDPHFMSDSESQFALYRAEAEAVSKQ